MRAKRSLQTFYKEGCKNKHFSRLKTYTSSGFDKIIRPYDKVISYYFEFLEEWVTLSRTTEEGMQRHNHPGIHMSLKSNTPPSITQYENCDLYTSILFSRKSYNSFSFKEPCEQWKLLCGLLVDNSGVFMIPPTYYFAKTIHGPWPPCKVSQ